MDYVIFLLIAIAGILIHGLFKIRDFATKNPGNSVGWVFKNFDWSLHMWPSMISLVIMAVLIYLRDELTILGMPFTKLSVLFYSYMADSIWKNLESFWSKKVNIG